MSIDPVSAAITIASTLASRAQAAGRANARSRALARNAAMVRQQAALEESESRRRTKQVLGRQRALFAKSGVKLEGTPLLVQQETATEGELDALAIRRSGDLREARLLNEARAARLQGRNALLSGVFRAGRTILTARRPSPRTPPTAPTPGQPRFPVLGLPAFRPGPGLSLI